MCIELEAFLSISAIFGLIISTLNLIYCHTIGKLFERNKKAVLEQTFDTKEIHEYGNAITSIASLISITSTYIWEHPFIIFLCSLAYFIIALYLPDIICH